MSDGTGISYLDSAWQAIPSWPAYEVTRDGSIRNAKTQRSIRLRPALSGHLYFYPARARKCYAHRAVLEAFTGPCPEGMEARHLDGNPAHNSIDNLAWGTRQENSDDKSRHGTKPIGERCGSAKLADVDVVEIRRRLNKESSRVLAAEYGVSHTTILAAGRGRRWTHLAEPGSEGRERIAAVREAMRKRRAPRVMVFCACGCEEQIQTPDRQGRRRRYACGHGGWRAMWSKRRGQHRDSVSL